MCSTEARISFIVALLSGTDDPVVVMTVDWKNLVVEPEMEFDDEITTEIVSSQGQLSLIFQN